MVDIVGRAILDSRGNPTAECDGLLESDVTDRVALPSRDFTGSRENIELRDGDKSSYRVQRDCKIQLYRPLWAYTPGCAAGAQLHGAQSMIECNHGRGLNRFHIHRYYEKHLMLINLPGNSIRMEAVQFLRQYLNTAGITKIGHAS